MHGSYTCTCCCFFVKSSSSGIAMLPRFSLRLNHMTDGALTGCVSLARPRLRDCDCSVTERALHRDVRRIVLEYLGRVERSQAWRVPLVRPWLRHHHSSLTEPARELMRGILRVTSRGAVANQEGQGTTESHSRQAGQPLRHSFACRRRIGSRPCRPRRARGSAPSWPRAMRWSCRS